MGVLETERKLRRKSVRYLVDYLVPRADKPVHLKVDTRFLEPRFATAVEEVAGIRSYGVGAPFEQKLAATSSRSEASDLFDLAFMVTRLADSMNDGQVFRLQRFIRDPRRLDRRYRELFDEDLALQTTTTYNNCKRDLKDAVASEIARRGIKGPQQRILTSEPIFQKILAYHQRRFAERTDDRWTVRDRSRTDDWGHALSC